MTALLSALVDDPAGWSAAQRWTALISAQAFTYVSLAVGATVTWKRLGATKKAVETAPTANGWTKRNDADMAEIKKLIRETRSEVRKDIGDVRTTLDQHILDHAGADVRRRTNGDRDG